MASIETQRKETEASLNGEANPEGEMILYHASSFDPKLSGSLARAAHYQGR
jgi:hypothetical protein